MVADPVLGWRLAPSVHNRSNSSGFRSNREFEVGSPGKYPVALIGDSFTFGIGVEYDQTFGSILESRLHGAPVYNFGMLGFAMDQMWQTLRREALPLRPSLVVVSFISGDFSRTPEAYRPWEGFNKPVYKLNGGELVLRTAADRPNFLFRFIDEHSSLWRASRLAARTLSHRIPLGEWWYLNRRSWMKCAPIVKSRGVPLLFVYIPTEEWTRFPALRSYMQSVHANFVDMTEGNLLPPTGTTLPDGHLNAAGNRYLADAIAQWVRAKMPDL